MKAHVPTLRGRITFRSMKSLTYTHWVMDMREKRWLPYSCGRGEEKWGYYWEKIDTLQSLLLSNQGSWPMCSLWIKRLETSQLTSYSGREDPRPNHKAAQVELSHSPVASNFSSRCGIPSPLPCPFPF